MTAKGRYIELVTELLVRRAGGALPDEEEDRYSDDLDRCWYEMSRSDQDELELSFPVDVKRRTVQGAITYTNENPEMTNEAINTLRKQAYQVYETWPARAGVRLSARGVARRLWPYIYAASTRYSEAEMRRACEYLAGTTPAEWEEKAETTLEISLASTAAALLRESTLENVHAALAFWASETDPAEWQAVIH